MIFGKALDKVNIQGISVGIYGAGGTGKTSLVKMLPPDETLYISIDDSSHPIRARNFFFVQLPKPTKENPKGFINALNDVYETLRTDKSCNIRYVIIDSISELERYFQMASVFFRNAGKRNVSEADSVPVQKDYGDASIQAYKYLILFRDLKNPLNTACKKIINSIFIANEMSENKVETSTKKHTKLVPFLTTKMAGKFRDAVDILGYMQVMDNGERNLILNPSQEIEAKNRFRDINTMKVPYDFDIIKEVINPIKQEIAQVFNIKKEK